jgi:hypothetical protein
MRHHFLSAKGCKMHPNCTQFRRFLFAKSPRKSFGMYGGDDGARTRDLCPFDSAQTLALAFRKGNCPAELRRLKAG